MNTFSMSYFQGPIPNEEEACGAQIKQPASQGKPKRARNVQWAWAFYVMECLEYS